MLGRGAVNGLRLGSRTRAVCGDLDADEEVVLKLLVDCTGGLTGCGVGSAAPAPFVIPSCELAETLGIRETPLNINLRGSISISDGSVDDGRGCVGAGSGGSASGGGGAADAGFVDAGSDGGGSSVSGVTDGSSSGSGFIVGSTDNGSFGSGSFVTGSRGDCSVRNGTF